MCTYIYIYIYIYRICTSCSEREANVYADVHNICLTYTSAHAGCSTVEHLWMHADSLPKCIWTRVCAPMQQRSNFLAIEAIANLSWVLREHRADCRLPLALLPPALLLAVRQLILFAKNPSKSTLPHDVVATAVLYKHHLIIRAGAGLIQFVYGSHSRGPRGSLHQKFYFCNFFARVFVLTICYWLCNFCYLIGGQHFGLMDGTCLIY